MDGCSRRHPCTTLDRMHRLVIITPCRKVYLAGRIRIHHGLVGAAAMALAVLRFSVALRAALLILGTALVWDDRRDWPFPLRDASSSTSTPTA